MSYFRHSLASIIGWLRAWFIARRRDGRVSPSQMTSWTPSTSRVEMAEPSWYEVVSTLGIEQGDILAGCPTPMVASPTFPVNEGEPISIDVVDLTLIVLTQSCDLENDKVDEVLLAEVVDWETVKATGGQHVKATEFRRALVQGNVPGYSLLSKSRETVVMNWSLVDFHRLHVLPKVYIERFAAQAGDRLRMLSPYREHLAQGFARYFMRVGLPHDAKAFVAEGK